MIIISDVQTISRYWLIVVISVTGFILHPKLRFRLSFKARSTCLLDKKESHVVNFLDFFFAMN